MLALIITFKGLHVKFAFFFRYITFLSQTHLNFLKELSISFSDYFIVQNNLKAILLEIKVQSYLRECIAKIQLIKLLSWLILYDNFIGIHQNIIY